MLVFSPSEGTGTNYWPIESDSDARIEELSALEPAVDVKSEIEAKFRRLAQEWIRDTEHESITAAMEAHPAFEQMKEMGHGITSFVFAELEREPNARWLVLLRAIFGTSPIPPTDRGNIQRMAAAWLQWQTYHPRYLD